MAVKTFTAGEVLTASDTNTYLANSGLVYINTYTLPSSGTAYECTGAFSSTYDNYRIVFSNVSTAVSDAINLRIGTNNSNIYYGSWNYALYTATELTVNPINANSQAVIALTNSAGPDVFGALDIANPYATKQTMWTGSYYGRAYTGTFGGVHTATTSYTSFSIVTVGGGSSLAGGTVTVYGYRKA